MNGLPPTPPSTGCLGIVIDFPAGCSAISTCLSTVYSCVPFRLLLKVISTPKPPSAARPSSVMFGPGLLLQSVTVRAAFTLTGNGSSVMLMWGRDDVEENEGASGCRELSRQAPVRMKAPARASNVLVRMTRFSFARRWLPELQELPVALVTAIRVPSKWETCTHDGRRNWCWSVAIA